MAWYLNKYECSRCGVYWEDEWSCCCDDECPGCGDRHYSPIDSDDISAFTESTKEGFFDIYYSPPSAGHDPDYEILARTTNKRLAFMLEEIAFVVAKPA
ncbi:MAG: hypothetical protein KDD62_09400 [Bdellovibrionales bacterium]|nr:hypothetical protein [Bdellovibrionales bacterium]